jgi:phage tail-like protein
MAEAKQPIHPEFLAFNFLVQFRIPSKGDSQAGNIDAAFAECDGLEMNMQPKTIREGGNNTRPIHLTGPVTYGQLTLKRGMTSNFDLWQWFQYVQTDKGRGYRPDIAVSIKSVDGSSTRATFLCRNCLPVKLKAPSLNAKDGFVAIEEIQIAYETLTLTGNTP